MANASAEKYCSASIMLAKTATVTHDFEAFVREELPARESPAYPPTVRLANVVISGTNEQATADLALAAREGYVLVEHAKRYTTTGMGVDQGKIGNITAFGILGAAMLGTLGLIAGLWAEKFDQMAAFQNFVIMPMTFLSGVFYSIHSLPAFWQGVSHLNPFFYMIDGFRYGFFGVSDVSPWISLGLVSATFAVVAGIALHLLRIGYKIRG